MPMHAVMQIPWWLLLLEHLVQSVFFLDSQPSWTLKMLWCSCDARSINWYWLNDSIWKLIGSLSRKNGNNDQFIWIEVYGIIFVDAENVLKYRMTADWTGTGVSVVYQCRKKLVSKNTSSKSCLSVLEQSFLGPSSKYFLTKRPILLIPHGDGSVDSSHMCSTGKVCLWRARATCARCWWVTWPDFFR